MKRTSNRSKPRSSLPPTPSAREEAAKLIGRVLRDQAYANRLLDASLTAQAWDPRDGNLLTELVYGVLRHLYAIDTILDGLAQKGVDSIDPTVRGHLQVAVYQMLKLDRIPTRAVISEAVDLVRKQKGKAVGGFVNAMLRTLQREPARLQILAEGKSTIAWLSQSTSHPEWLVSRYTERWGEDGAKARLEANNQPGPHTIRVNPTWGTREAWLAHLQAANIEARPTTFAPEGIVLTSHQGAALRELMQQHPTACTVQDEAAQLLAHWVAPEAGEQILDACAAPGGKTTHLATLAPTATITAFDLHKHKISLIRQACQRMGLTNITATQTDATTPLDESLRFDRILCDAPCSGLGILRRQPEIRYRRTPEDLLRLQALQLRLLDNLSQALQPGGLLVYSVCTDTEEETTQVASQFLAAHPDFASAPQTTAPDSWHTLLNEQGQLRTTPEHHDMDGFFAARWRKRK